MKAYGTALALWLWPALAAARPSDDPVAEPTRPATSAAEPELPASAPGEMTSPPSADLAPPASSPQEVIRQARQAMEELRYDDARRLAQSIGDRAPGLARLAALEIRATLHLIEANRAKAAPILEELFDLAPAFLLEDPALSPKVTRPFDEEAARPHRRAVTLQLRDHGADLRTFALVAGGDTAEVSLVCRAKPDGAPFHVSTTYADSKAVFRLPTQGRVYCYAVALDREGLPLGRLGAPSAPVVIAPRQPPAPSPEPVTTRWWFWTSIAGGLAVTVGVIATVVVVSQGEPPPPAEVDVILGSQGALPLFRW
ncbi:MAG TPA: hypothetical protein ENK57_19240 [Polyangiaceae bacterium]|nr:hypothetical protein [Polyangiaceae bacterium]